MRKLHLALIALCAMASSVARAGGMAQGADDAPSFTEVRRALHAGSTVTVTPYVIDADRWDRHRIELLSAPQSGSASVTPDGRRIVYAAAATPGTDSFAYRAIDRRGHAVDGVARMVVYDDATLATCRQDSTVTPAGVLDTRTKSNGCAFYGQTATRTSAQGAVVSMDYFVNWPSSGATPKAVVVLIGGGDFNMAIRGNPDTGAGDVTGGANNFVVRTAQLYADAGYLAVALDRPVPGPAAFPDSTDITTATDYYRISVDHAIDILAVLKSLNVQGLPVFLAGTSRGSISVVAQNRIASGILTSSSVTRDPADNGRHLYVGRPDTPSLLPQSVVRPTHVLWHEQDGCFGSPPTGSRALYDSLVAAGVDTAFEVATGGVRVTAAGNGVSPDVCGPLNFHGYMGIENAVVGRLTAWLDAHVPAAAHVPRAEFAEVGTAAETSRRIALHPLTRGRDGCELAYSLHGLATSLGGQVALNGSVVTYTPPAGLTSGTDAFVYTVTDGQGGVASAVVSVRIGS